MWRATAPASRTSSATGCVSGAVSCSSRARVSSCVASAVNRRSFRSEVSSRARRRLSSSSIGVSSTGTRSSLIASRFAALRAVMAADTLRIGLRPRRTANQTMTPNTGSASNTGLTIRSTMPRARSWRPASRSKTRTCRSPRRSHSAKLCQLSPSARTIRNPAPAMKSNGGASVVCNSCLPSALHSWKATPA